jgi:sec-independent protein translocase protein TatA
MIEGLFAPMHLLIIGSIALLVFGPSRLPELGRGFGQAIRGFKAGLEEIGAARHPAATQLAAEVPTRVDTAPRFGSGTRESDTIEASAAAVEESAR